MIRQLVLRKALVCLGGTAVLILMITLWLAPGKSPPLPSDEDGRIDMAAAEEYWSARVRKVGMKDAYVEFKSFYKDKPLIAHTAAHIMGELSYEHEGADGLAICDGTFGFGCFHQHVVRSTTEHGTDAVADLGKVCIDTHGPHALACFHGIGHGVHQYFGPDRLLEALATCALMPEAGVADCERGVFMDYFVPFMVENEDPYGETRAFDPAHRYGVCVTDAIPAAYRDSCYFSLPHWWHQQQDLTLAEIRAWCTDAGVYVRDCYVGMTVDLPGTVQFDIGRIVTECSELPDRASSALCMRGSAYTLSSIGVDPCPLLRELGDDGFGCSNEGP